MSTTELTTKIENINTLQTMIDELTAEMEAAKDEVKAEMTAQGVDELTVSCFKVRYKEVKSSRFDSTAFKKNTFRPLRTVLQDHIFKTFFDCIKEKPLHKRRPKQKCKSVNLHGAG